MHRPTLLTLAGLGLATALVIAPLATAHPTDLLTVDDGEHFYDLDGDCANGGETNDPTAAGARTLRHWHAGAPFLGADAELAGGFGCLQDPEPQTHEITVDPDHGAIIDATIYYTWDQTVDNGGQNDVHLHVYDETGAIVKTTLDEDGPDPVLAHPANGDAPAIKSHTLDTALNEGTYTFQVDVYSGLHTTWLTNINVDQGHLQKIGS